jgi:predicted PurR-regulated permease PerM
MHPTENQRRLLWTAAASFAVAGLAGLLALTVWLMVQFLSILYPVLLPLGFAGIIAFILDPVVTVFEKRGWRRSTSILTVAAVLTLFTIALGIYVIPPLISQTLLFFENFPQTFDRAQNSVTTYFANHPELSTWINHQASALREAVPGWISRNVAEIWKPLQQFFNWIGLALGFLLVPLYVYYFLLEKKAIKRDWKKYLPLHHSPWRDEIVVVLSEINKYLIVFFRGQVLVGLCIGILTALGLGVIGLPYALLIGLIAGVLSIIPYLGVISSLVPALLIAAFSSQSWNLFLGVLVVFAVVQFLEGMVISPRILGNRTGLHPMTIMVSILVWSLFLPGLIGPIFAVPLTATLRVLMYRYVWLKALRKE